MRTTRMDGVQVRHCAVHPAAVELGKPLEANGLVACTAWQSIMAPHPMPLVLAHQPAALLGPCTWCCCVFARCARVNAHSLLHSSPNRSRRWTRCCAIHATPHFTGVLNLVFAARFRPPQVKTLDEVLHDLVESGVSPDELYDAVTRQHVEIVLTAHPTQVNRRTLQHKHTRIATLLAQVGLGFEGLCAKRGWFGEGAVWHAAAPCPA